MVDGYVEKAVAERKSFTADFTNEVPSGDSIKTIGQGSETTALITDSTGADVTSAMLHSVAISTTTLVITLKAGTDKQDYLVTAIAEMTTATTKFRKYYDLRVRDGRRSV